MTPAEQTALAQDIAERVANHPGGVCHIGLTKEDAAGIRLLGRIAGLGSKTAFITGIGLLVAGACSMFVAGFILWIRGKS